MEVKKSTTSRFGMVAAAHPDAARIGAEILDKGGNAFDAAVAVGFALGVCEPNASGLGGGGYMTAYSARDQKAVFVDFREVAPASANPDMWKLDENGAVIGEEKGEGGKSICVPGEAAGLCYIQEKFGRLSREEVMESAIELARWGEVISEALHHDLLDNRNKLKRFEEPGNPYLKDYQPGDRLQNPDLVHTMEMISKEGPDAFYHGEIAQAVVNSINAHGGDFTLDDMAGFQVRESVPLRGNYRGYEILSSPPPSSGGTHILECLNIMEQFPVGEMEYHSARHLHLMSEVFKMSFADRAKYMGDPRFVEIPLKGLLSREYAQKRAAAYEPFHVTPAEPDDPFRFEPSDTTHFSVADREGNVVSITQTISSFFGSGVVPEGTGVVLNCQMRGFTLGKGKKNSVQGGKKPLSSMSPTIILKDGRPFAAIGTPGGNRIISTMVQIISNLIDFKMDLVDAIDAPRCYNDVPNLFQYEERIQDEVVQTLVENGQPVKKLKAYDRYVGGVQGIRFSQQEESMIGAADPRRDGMAAGSSVLSH